MSEIFLTGAQIPLSAELFKNDIAKTGQSVKVSVFDIFGNELLSETDVPETARLGQYTFVWKTAPNIPINAKAYYRWVEENKTVSELLRIEMISSDGFVKLSGTIGNKRLIGSVKEKSKLSGFIGNKKLVGNVKEKRKLKGVIRNIRLIGEIK